MVSAPNICVICKGRNFCGNYPCPLIPRFKIKDLKLDYEFFGPSTSVFIGHLNYPNVFVGPICAIKNEEIVDNPKKWFGFNYQKIVEIRSLTIRSKLVQNVKAKNKFIEENQLLAISNKPTEVEIKFSKRPVYKISFSEITQPMGPSAKIKRMKVIENPKVPLVVDKVIEDDLVAADQVKLLYKHFDVYYIMNVFSSGVLGKKENQKLVPTRWSITAIDDILGKILIEKIKGYKEINSFFVYESNYLGNKFSILLIPGKWEYENFEAWAPGSSWARNLKNTLILKEYEPYEGRKSYADKECGGYYAARFAVCEALEKMKRQAKVIVFREISEKYVVPLGVWQVRENVRNAMRSPPKKFETIKEAISYLRMKLKIPIEEYLKISRILQQKSLFDFFT